MKDEGWDISQIYNSIDDDVVDLLDIICGDKTQTAQKDVKISNTLQSTLNSHEKYSITQDTSETVELFPKQISPAKMTPKSVHSLMKSNPGTSSDE